MSGDKLIRQKHLTSDGRKAQPQERVGTIAPDADPDVIWPGASRRRPVRTGDLVEAGVWRRRALSRSRSRSRSRD